VEVGQPHYRSQLAIYQLAILIALTAIKAATYQRLLSVQVLTTSLKLHQQALAKPVTAALIHRMVREASLMGMFQHNCHAIVVIVKIAGIL
jgi:hypothetical protein